MATLIPLRDLSRDRNYDFSTEGNIFDPTGQTAYGMNGEKVGTVKDAMVEPDSGRLRYLRIDVGGWFDNKEVLVPIGMARVEDDGVYFDSLTKDQVRDLHDYGSNSGYDREIQTRDEQVLRGGSGGMMSSRSVTGTSNRYDYRDDDNTDTMFNTPNRLQLLEERLIVDKERYIAGSVEVSKHVENRQQQVQVDVSHDELIIERRPVTDGRPADPNARLGSSETVRVDLEAERAEVRKQAYVTEEVEIGKRTETEVQTMTETVGREVLDVNHSGNVDVQGADRSMGMRDTTGSTGTRDTTGSTGLGVGSMGGTGSMGGRTTDTHQTSGVTGHAGATPTPMTGTGMSRITAVFSNERDAEAAVADLRRLGITDSHLSVIRRGGDGNNGQKNLEQVSGSAPGTDPASGAGKGALAGAGVGALLGLAAAAIPGIGPFITAGALAATLGTAGGAAAAGALVGATAGTIAGALANVGYSHEEARYYGDAVERGGILVAIESNSVVAEDQVREVLRRHNGEMHSGSSTR